MDKFTILVADDHPLLLKGLVDELVSNGYDVLPGANNGAEALELIQEHTPNVALLDIEMPILSGFEVINKCLEKEITTKFIMLTSHKERAYVLKAKKLNISGYLLKDEPYSEIHKAIETIKKGENYFSHVFDAVFNQEITPQIELLKFLSPSERTILRLVAQGKTSKEIGEALTISYRTVQKHRGNIISKLNLSTSADALTTWTEENRELILSL